MKKRIFTAVSLFGIIPILVFSMIFPIAVFSFSVLKIDTIAVKIPYEAPENSSQDMIDSAFLKIPSNGNHPIGDYIEQSSSKDCEKLNALPQIIPVNSILPDDAKAIYPSDMSQSGNPLINDTDYKIDIEEEISAFAPLKETGSSPLVLVLHTHATESFTLPEESYNIINDDGTQTCYYSPSDSTTRTTDNTKNVVHLGEIFTQTLNSMGIPTIHCQTQHDYPEYNKSYSNSYSTVQEYLEKYPSIEYIVDLHRDSIVRQNGEKIKPVYKIDGQNTAQIMLVMGTGSNHPNWRRNLSLALKFKSVADEIYPGLSRPVYLRSWSFNQELCTGSVILEVGSCANTLKEAERAATLAAEIFAHTIIQ